MTKFEEQLLATLSEIQKQAEDQSRAVKELQIAFGNWSDEQRGFYERLAKDSAKNFREHRHYQRAIEKIAEAFPGIGIDTTSPAGAE